ncbi:MAG: beta-ketoacyl-ACP synthase III [Hyphomicrobiaceae bacterium]|nr:beta-ketoacyl-ACP synthase III [Hyphomicrobiaceae bacterium]
MSGVEILGLGHYAPARRVPNSEIEQRLGLEPGWIERRTGIKARRYVADDEALSDMAVAAGDMALRNSGLARDDVGLLLLATSTPDHLLPPTAPLVAHRLGLANAGGIDMAGACGGFIYALTLADSFVRTHGRPVLVIAANVLSRRINVKDRASSVLFADAAGAALLAPTPRAEAGVVAAELASKGSGYDLIHIPGGGSRKPFSALASAQETLMIISDGQAVYSEAIDMMTKTAQTALTRANAKLEQITRFIPHQANQRMMDKVLKRLGLPQETLASTIAEHGNSSAATIPFTLSVSAAEQPLKREEMLLLTAAGAGLTGGAVVWRC